MTFLDVSSPNHAPSLPAVLDPVTYARGHALFEARSDQRATIVSWLQARLSERSGDDAISVLSVGCGDGSVDRPLAEHSCAGAAGSAGRSWTGVDPHAASAAKFTDELAGLCAQGLTVRTHACTFADLETDERFDVITFVHSLYYVAEVGAALADALCRLAPGGELLILHAPLGRLNELAETMTTRASGRRQPWSHDVADELALLAVDVRQTELVATVDLTECAEDDPALLDFTVQARLDGSTRPGVVAVIGEIAKAGAGLRVAHPVTAFAVRPLTEGARPCAGA